jgi:hypothetical protein
MQRIKSGDVVYRAALAGLALLFYFRKETEKENWMDGAAICQWNEEVVSSAAIRLSCQRDSFSTLKEPPSSLSSVTFSAILIVATESL